MTEEERARFIEETLPTGFKQMMDAFEQLPDERRKKALEDIMKRLRETHKLVMDREPGSTTDAYGTNGPPPFSPEQEKRILAVGLKTFYSTSSAQTKAEVAPLLEELQHQLEAGRGFR
jgi:ClpP class serine protease